MDTRNGLIDRPPATPAPDSQALAAALVGLRLLATRPAVPGLALVAALLVAAMAGWTLTSAAWFWPSCAGLALSTMVIGTLRQDLWRQLQTRRHRQRIDTAHQLLSERPAAAEAEIAGSIRELGGRVEQLGDRLDALLAEVHTERTPRRAAPPESPNSTPEPISAAPERIEGS